MSDGEVYDGDDDEGDDWGVDGVMTKMATEVMVEFLKSQVNIRTYALLFKSEKQVPGIRQNR